MDGVYFCPEYIWRIRILDLIIKIPILIWGMLWKLGSLPLPIKRGNGWIGIVDAPWMIIKISPNVP